MFRFGIACENTNRFEVFSRFKHQDITCRITSYNVCYTKLLRDLNQVHNLGNVEAHLETLRQSKEAGRTRYVGITTSRYEQFEQMESLLKRETLDFVQLNYSLGERRAADRLLPLAQERAVV